MVYSPAHKLLALKAPKKKQALKSNFFYRPGSWFYLLKF